MEEHVLVFPAALLSRLGKFHGFSSDTARCLPVILADRNLRYLPRSQAEGDPSFKQLIPYIVLKAGETVFCYERGVKGNEQRLHRMSSLGIGGHICREDGAAGRAGYEAGYARELAEEVEIAAPYESRIIGMLYDETTEVGSVHFGIVHLLELAEPSVRPLDSSLARAGFRPIAEIQRNRAAFESWSGFVIEQWFGARVAAKTE